MKKKILIALIVVVVIAVLAGGGYFAVLKIQENKALEAIDTMFTAIKSGDEATINKYINTEENNTEEPASEESSVDEEKMYKTVVQNLNYEVVSKDTKLNNVTVQLNVSNKNFAVVFGNYMKEAFSLAMSSAFGGVSEEEMNQKMEQCLIDQYNSDAVETVTNQVTVTVKKENGEWKIDADSAQMANALLPGLQEVTQSLDSMATEE